MDVLHSDVSTADGKNAVSSQQIISETLDQVLNQSMVLELLDKLRAEYLRESDALKDTFSIFPKKRKMSRFFPDCVAAASAGISYPEEERAKVQHVARRAVSTTTSISSNNEAEMVTRSAAFDLKCVWISSSPSEIVGMSTITNNERDELPEQAVSGLTRPMLPTTYIISPHSTGRIIFDVFCVFCLLYDVVMLPFQAFNPPPSDACQAIEHAIFSYWVVDMVLSFFTAQYRKGLLEAQHSQIIKSYLRTWFCLDVTVLMLDIIPMVWDKTAGQEGYNGIGTALRASRFLRIVRLLRVWKLQRVTGHIQERVQSEYMFTLLCLGKLLIFVLICSHMIACLWYYIGEVGMQSNGPSWLLQDNFYRKNLMYLYTTSLHYSLTQFTPASMEVFPTNAAERTFSIIVVLTGLFAFSSILANITRSFACLQGEKTERTKQLWLLRRALRKRNVKMELIHRIFRYLEHQLAQTQCIVTPTAIPVLNQVSGPLRDELSSALLAPILMIHPLFRFIYSQASLVMHWLCMKAVQTIFAAEQDNIFMRGVMADFAHCVQHGHLILTTVDQVHDIHENVWLAEHCLWTKWVHPGNCTAGTTADIIAVKPVEFGCVIASHPRLWAYAGYYGRKFVAKLNRMPMDELSDLILEGFWCENTPDPGMEEILSETPRRKLSSSRMEVLRSDLFFGRARPTGKHGEEAEQTEDEMNTFPAERQNGASVSSNITDLSDDVDHTSSLRSSGKRLHAL